MLQRLAGWCYDRRRIVLAVWLVAVIGFGIAGQAASGALLKSFSLPGTESSRAFDILGRDFRRTGDTGQLVFRAKTGRVDDPAVRRAIEPVIAELAKQPHVASITSPYSAEGQRFVSQQGRIAYAELQFDVEANDVPLALGKDMRTIAKDANSDVVQVELGGTMFVDQTQPASEAIGILAAVLILLLAFGSLLAMGLPIITALAGIAIGMAIVQILAHVTDVPSFAPQVTAMIAIGVGIDYALFVVTRYRSSLHEGLEPRDAVIEALDTAGRAVLFAGSTVVISLLGLFAIGVSFIRGMAIGASLAVVLVMLASVTLLPAVLGFVGRTIDRFALRSAKRQTSDVTGSFWARWSRILQAHPWRALMVGLVTLVVLAIPVFSLRLGIADAGNDPTKQTTRRAYDLLSQGFGPGFNGPLLLVSETPNGQSDVRGMQALADRLKTDPDVAAVSPVIPSPNGRAAMIQVVPDGSPQDATTGALIHRLRDRTVPASIAGTDLSVHIGGQTAVGEDLAKTLGDRMPLFFTAVLVLSFLLLMLVFRSLLVPLKAVVMNLLSIGAAYGVIVAIFQWGWLRSAFGIGKAGPIEAWVPMMLFAIVFGLSMDYEVFLLSRIKEEYDRTHDNANAVAHGLAMTARVITAAAAIMICVFGSFVLSDMRVLKLVGLGLAVAVLIDATIVRLVLVPATMELLGDRNWWLPKWLQFLPRLDVEGTRRPGPGPAPDRVPEPVGAD